MKYKPYLSSLVLTYETLSQNHIKDLNYLYDDATYTGFMALMAGDNETWAKCTNERIELSLAINHKKYYKNEGGLNG